MSLIDLQKKIGVTADGNFGPGTLKAAAEYYHLSPQRAAHLFGQTGHETGNFRVFKENLNYGWKGLRGIFPKYFPTDVLAKQYERKPEKIANRAYANRMGNGNEASGDGYRFCGRSFIQTTGRSNYQQLADYLKRPDIMTNPELVATELSFEAALFFFERNKLWAICDQGVTDAAILALTKRVNGGTNGLDDRKAKTKLYASWLGL